MFDFIPNSVTLIAFGFILLIKGGDWFVDAATSIAKRFKLPELLIGATVVSIGTTLPEVMTSAMGAMEGSSAIAYGNAIGSIICNTSLIAALTIAIKPGKADKKALIFPVCSYFAVAAIYAGIAYTTGRFDRWFEDEAEEALECELPESGSKLGLLKDVAVLLVSALVIAFGADRLVEGATDLAIQLNVPETIISLTIVALGTSLPELVTAITALMKGHGALSLGNIIGANIFNLVLVSGAAITIAPFDVPASATFLGMNASFVFDIPLMIGVMALMTIPTVLTGKLRRWQGVSLLGLYGAYCVLQFVLIPMFP